MVTTYRISTWLAGGLFLLSMASVQVLYSRYTREMPQVQQFESGRTIPLDVLYGKTVYVTKRELYSLYGRVASAAGAGVLTVAMDQLRRRAERRRNKLKSASAST
jgi:hypothetical protein